MAAHVNCPACQGRIALAEVVEEGRGTCPHCGRAFKVAIPTKPNAARRDSIGIAPEAKSPPAKARAPGGLGRSDAVHHDQHREAPQPHDMAEFADGSELYGLDKPGEAASTVDDLMSGYDLLDEPKSPPLPSSLKLQPALERQTTKPEKKLAKKAARTEKARLDPKLLVGGGIGAVVVLVLIVGGLIAVFSGGGGGKAPGVADVAAGKDIDASGGKPIIVTSVDGSSSKPASIPSLFSAVAPAQSAIPKSRRRKSAKPVDVESSKGRWSIPADPRPSDEVYAYHDDIRIPIEKMHLKDTPELTGPVLADRGAPFAIFMPGWTESPYSVERGKGAGRSTHVVKEKPQPAVPVIDLRTGEAAGEFSWKSPFWGNPRLSPDGMHLVGMDAAPYWLRSQSYPDSIGKIEPNVLFVWKQKQNKPVHKLSIAGVVLWAEFVSNDRLALYISGEQASLQVWEVRTGKSVAEIPLSIAPFKLRTDPAEGRWGWYPMTLIGSSSAGGKYVAVGGVDAISLVSLADEKEVGTFPVTLGEHKHESEYRGVSFAPNGEELMALIDLGGQKMSLHTWSITNGTELRELTLRAGAGGPLAPGPEPNTILAIGYPFVAWGQNFLRSATDMHQGTVLLDATDGRYLARHPAIIRWSESGSVLALGPLVDPQADPAKSSVELPPIGVYATKAVRDVFHEAAGKTDFGLAKRPDPIEPDRSSMRAVSPEPPAAWTPPPRAEKAPPATTDFAYLADRPTSFGAKELAVVNTPRREHRQLYGTLYAYEVVWERYDIRTGKSLGDPLTLWPWAWHPTKHPGEPPRPMAALSPDDQKLALRDPDSLGRIDVWSADGKRIVGFYPESPEADVDWIGWDRQGRLLTVVSGVLTAWEIPSGKAIYEIDGSYSTPVDVSVSEGWLAISATTHVDLIDPIEGICLGRCTVDEVQGSIVDASVSPDSAKLTAVYFPGASSAADQLRAGQVNQTSDDIGDATVVVWDLQSCKAEKMPLRLSKFVLLHWGGPELLVVCDLSIKAYDLRAGLHVMNYGYGGSWPREGLPLLRSPDGRLWAAVESGYQKWGWCSMNVPDSKQPAEELFLRDDREFFAAPKEPVQVEVDAGSPALSSQYGSEIAKEFAKSGYQIGKAGWRLTVSHNVNNSGSSMRRGTTEFAIPKVEYAWQLVDPKGQQVWSNKVEYFFRASGSKYFKKTRTAYDFAPGEQQLTPFEQMEYYDFGNRDAREAIAEELMERGPGMEAMEKLPKLYFKVGDQYPTFPAGFSLPIRKAPDVEQAKGPKI